MISLDQGYSRVFITQRGDSALFLAALEGHVAVVKLLIEAGAMVNLQNKVWQTNLHNQDHVKHSGEIMMCQPFTRAREVAVVLLAYIQRCAL